MILKRGIIKIPMANIINTIIEKITPKKTEPVVETKPSIFQPQKSYYHPIWTPVSQQQSPAQVTPQSSSSSGYQSGGSSSVGGGSSSSRKPTFVPEPKMTYVSPILNKVFSSESERQKAEQEFLSKQSRQVSVAVKPKSLELPSQVKAEDVYHEPIIKKVQRTAVGQRVTEIGSGLSRVGQDLFELGGSSGKYVVSALSVPAQYMGAVLVKTYDEDSLKLFYEKGDSPLTRAGKLLNPVRQYKFALAQTELKISQRKVKEINKEMDKLELEFEKGKITADEYNKQVDEYYKNQDVQRMIKPRTDVFTSIKESELTEKQKGLTYGAVGVAQTMGYLIPAGRVILGVDTSIEGVSSFALADTTSEKIGAGIQTGLGVLSIGSGLSSMFGSGKVVSGSSGKLKLTKGVQLGIGTGIGLTYGALDYVSSKKRGASTEMAFGGALGKGGTVLAGVWYNPVKELISDKWRVRGMKEIKTPLPEDKPFHRVNPAGEKERVYYEWAQKVKWYNPKTWKYRGYEPGQFYQRLYELEDPLVMGRLAGKSHVEHWVYNDGEFIYVSEPTKPFSFDAPEEHLDWFLGQKDDIKRYYLPKKFLDTGSAIGMGKSASPSPRIDTDPVLNQYQRYYAGGAVQSYFYRVGRRYVQIGGSKGADLSTKPQLYMDYFTDIEKNPAIKEIVVTNPIDSAQKGWKQYVYTNPTKEGVLYIGGYKKEIEGTIFGSRDTLANRFYYKTLGRNIPISEGIYSSNLESAGNIGIDFSSISSKTTPPSSFIPTGSFVESPTTFFSTLSNLFTPSFSNSIVGMYQKKVEPITDFKVSDISNVDQLKYNTNIIPPLNFRPTLKSRTPTITPSLIKSVTPSIKSPYSYKPISFPNFYYPTYKPYKPYKPTPKPTPYKPYKPTPYYKPYKPTGSSYYPKDSFSRKDFFFDNKIYYPKNYFSGYGKSSKGKVYKFKGLTEKYQASLGAIALDIKLPKTEFKNYKGKKFTGLEIRPMLK